MARSVFYSFHYKPDNWRVSQVRNIGVLDGNKAATDNEWEKIVGQGDTAIQNWIKSQLKGRSCTIVLAGENTAGRKWINYEIAQSWDAGKGVLGIHIHNLLDRNQVQSRKGRNPLECVTRGKSGSPLSSISKCYDPPYSTSTSVYKHIADNVANWIDEAIAIRARN